MIFVPLSEDRGMETRYIAIDIETTGLDPCRHAICQIGAVSFDIEEIGWVKSWDVYVPDDAEVEEEALKVNGFTSDRLQSGLPVERVFDQLEYLIASLSQGEKLPIAVFHNAPFDVPFLKATKAIKHKSLFDLFLRRVLDTVSLGFMCGNRDGLSSLSNLAKEWISPERQDRWEKHTAAGDAFITAHIARALFRYNDYGQP